MAEKIKAPEVFNPKSATIGGDEFRLTKSDMTSRYDLRKNGELLLSSLNRGDCLFRFLELHPNNKLEEEEKKKEESKK